MASAGVRFLTAPEFAGMLVGLDAAGLLMAADPVRFEIARDAAAVLDDRELPAATTAVSSWQKDLAALRSEQLVRIAVRTDAAAVASTGSPA